MQFITISYNNHEVNTCDLGDNKPPISDLMSAGSQTLFNRQQNTNISSTIGNIQSEQELQASQQNRHLAFGSTNIAAPNMEFIGSGHRYILY